MYSKTSIILLASLALAQGIAIGKPADNKPEGTTTQLVSANPNNGFVVQTGYEGYITSPQKTALSTSSNNFSWIIPTLTKVKLLKSLMLPISGALVVYGAKIITVGLHLVLSMLLGVAATTAVCSFTPICSFSLSLPGLELFKGKSVKEQVAEYARTYMTKENMEMVSQVVQSALNKYGTNQPREVEQPASSEQDNETTASN